MAQALCDQCPMMDTPSSLLQRLLLVLNFGDGGTGGLHCLRDKGEWSEPEWEDITAIECHIIGMKRNRPRPPTSLHPFLETYIHPQIQETSNLSENATMKHTVCAVCAISEAPQQQFQPAKSPKQRERKQTKNITCTRQEGGTR